MMSLKSGRYTIDSDPIGDGYTSKVFSGVDNEKGVKVAVKRMSAIEDAKLEATFMQKCSPNPFVVQYYDFFIEGSYAYIVMNFHPGQRLGYYKYCKPLDFFTSIQITINILKGLNEINASGMLHCDITPHNVLVFNNDPSTVKIIDFGCIVEKNKYGEYKGWHKGGTLGYMPPELFRGDVHLDDSSDLFGAACVCIYLLTGKAPFQLKGICQLIQNKTLRDVLLRAGDNNRFNRYRSANEFIAALTPFLPSKPAINN